MESLNPQPYHFNNLYIALLLWVILYSADYYLTLWGNRLRNQYGKQHVEFEGSYELNPLYQRDIDRMVKLSPRFVLALITFAAVLSVIWWLARELEIPEIFALAAGMMVGMELAVIATHLQNITVFSAMKTPGAVEGKIKYARWVSLRIAVRNFAYWSLVYFVLFLLTGNWLLLGGTLSCAAVFLRFRRMETKIRQATSNKPEVIM
jgi:hypothetical protein